MSTVTILCIGDAYGGTLELIGQQLPQLGVRTHLELGSEPERLDTLLAEGAGLVFLETPTNPTLEVLDIAAMATRVHAPGGPAGRRQHPRLAGQLAAPGSRRAIWWRTARPSTRGATATSRPGP